MRLHPSVFLAAALCFAGASPSRAMPAGDTIEGLAQTLRDDPKARAEAGVRIEFFLLKSTPEFVSADADQAALGAVARAWAAKANARDLATLDFVCRRGTLRELRLNRALIAWTMPKHGEFISTADSASAFLEDAVDKAALVLADRRTRREIETSIEGNNTTPPTVPNPDQAVKRAKAVRVAPGLNTGVFGPDRAAPDLEGRASAMDGLKATAGGPTRQPGQPGQTGRRSPEEMAALIADLNAAHRAGRDGANLPPVTSKAPPPLGVDVEPPVEFQSLGSVEVAPAPGALDRAASLASRDAPTVAADLKQIHDSLQNAELPTAQALNDNNPDAIRQFFVWLRTAKEDDMPAIDYTILPKGEVGHYELGLLSKGDIKVNHFVRNAPANARASVVVHELYHYWDKKVARNYYPNVSYGVIDPANKHIHEYDAYLATSLYWQMVKKEGDSSPLARLLDRIPTDQGQVRELVNGAVGAK